MERDDSPLRTNNLIKTTNPTAQSRCCFEAQLTFLPTKLFIHFWLVDK